MVDFLGPDVTQRNATKVNVQAERGRTGPPRVSLSCQQTETSSHRPGAVHGSFVTVQLLTTGQWVGTDERGTSPQGPPSITYGRLGESPPVV